MYCSIANARVSVNNVTLKQGDVIVQKNKDNTWSVIKVLEVDRALDIESSVHCLIFKSVHQKPNLEQIGSLEILAYHAPISLNGFDNKWEIIGNVLPRKEELVGFIEYLKLTNFDRYLEFTNQDLLTIVHKANLLFKEALIANNKEKHREAIKLYSEAINLFPQFYEAVDNRGFTYMDLGLYDEALEDFQLSLEINPTGLTAINSKKECLARISFKKALAANKRGNHKEAIKFYSEAIDSFPSFYEAFDNRGLTYLNLELYEKALEDFNLSLAKNPTGLFAIRAKKECLLRIDRRNSEN